jgi:DNA-binding winged helix-turn-helix (wHTH) protein/Tol biopolymer transport system component
LETANGNKSGHSAKGHRYTFDRFEVDPANRILLRSGETVPLTGKVFDVLLVFAENPSRLLSKDELIERVWPGDFVEEGNLARNVSTLRKVLGDEEKPYKYIATVPGRGYRFVAELNTEYDRTGISNAAVPEPKIAISGILRRRPFLIGAVAILLFLAFGFAVSKITKATRPAAFSVPLSLSRLTSSGHVFKVALSPDGNLMAFVARDKSGESLSIRQVGMGNDVNLVPPIKGTFINITFSPDGKLIYYSIFSGGGSEIEFYSIPILGGMSRRVPGEATGTVSFAPDGRHFARVVSSSNRGNTTLVVRDQETGDERTLVSRNAPAVFNAWGQACSWSPDGSSIAVISNEIDAAGHFASIVSVDPVNGSERPFSQQRWNYVESIQWMSDGSGLLVAGSDRTESPGQIWFVNADGESRRLTNDLNNYSGLGSTSAGQAVVSVQESRTSSIWVSPLAQKTAAPVELVSGVGTMAPIAVEQDGRVIFRSNAGGGSDLWTAAADGSSKRQLTIGAMVDFRGLASTSDGKYAAFASAKSGKTNIWLAAFDGSEPRRLTDGDNEIFPAFTPDGRFVIYQRGGTPGSKTSLWKVSIDGGEPSQLTDYFSVRATVSPDGKHIAFFYMTDEKWMLGTVSINGGALERSLEIPDGLTDRIARWSPDSRSLLIVANAGDIGNIWRIPLNGGPSVQITSFDRQNIEDFAISADGQQLAATRSTTVSDVVLASPK